MATVTETPPPVFPLAPRAVALVANIEQGVRGDWRQGAGLQHNAVVYRAQAVRECAGETNPHLRGGVICARVLELVPVTIDPLHLFAANGIMPTASEEEIAAAYAYLTTQPPLRGHSHHISLNYEALIRRGVRGLLAEVDAHEARLSARPEDDDARAFYQGVRLALHGLVRYGERYRAEAERLLAAETEPQRRAELARMRDALTHVPLEPAETLFEAIQSLLLLHFGSRTHDCDSAVGRLDLLMDAYYRRDLAEGRITQAEAATWVQMLLAQLLELTRFSDCIVVGGSQADGVTPCWNDLSYFILDAAAQLKLPTPEIGFRYQAGQPRALLRRAMACVQAGTGHPGFFNDPVAIAALEGAGLTRAQAADYANCNCVELTSIGRSFIMSGYNYTNLVKVVECLLNGGAPLMEEEDPWLGVWRIPPYDGTLPREYASFDDFLTTYEDYLDQVIDELVDTSNAVLRDIAAGGTYLSLSSAFIAGCLASGRHAACGGALCQPTFPSFVGFGNAVDALAAIEHAVFTERRYTLEEIAAACRANFEGYAELHAYLRTACPKYGNDDPRADALARRLFARVAASLCRHTNIHGQAYAPQYFGFISHARKGAHTAATPDGRLRGASVAGTLGGDSGTDTQGPTALLRSAAGLQQVLASGGVAVNLALSPSALRTAEDVERAIDLLLAYFALGGMQLQLNCVSADTLRDAQHHPDQHRHLLVRVAGYSDRFVCLEANLQEEIIGRTQHGVG